MTDEQFEKLLESALKRDRHVLPPNDAAIERVLKRLSRPLPRQKQPLWRLPPVLLDWQFAPAWPRMAALACCAAAGFAIGLTGVDRRFEDPGVPSAYAVGGGGIGTITFEPDAFTGARP